MPRFKPYDYKQTVMLPVDFEQQILPGTFEYSLHYLVDNELDLSIFNSKFNNDEAGRPAYDPAILLKIVLLAYSRGVTSSRKIEALCRENVIFMALSADSRPHFTTIADFISGSAEQIADLFHQVLMVCDALGLIGHEMFAVDGCKMPSNASKEWSGTHDDLKKKAKKIDRAVRFLLNKHREEDKQGPPDPTMRQREEKQKETLTKASRKIKKFLTENKKRQGRRGKEVKSNITDNDSAKMKTSHGVLQGYTGVAAVDAEHQVVVHAEAFGTGQEHGLLEPMLEGIRKAFNGNYHNCGDEILSEAKILADSGFHSGQTLEHLEEEGIDGYIADPGFRSRDPRFKTASRHKPEDTRASKIHSKKRFSVSDFQVDIANKTCVCPAGNPLWLKCAKAKIGERLFMQFMGYQADCDRCAKRSQCLRDIRQKGARQVNVLLETLSSPKVGIIERMKQKIDSVFGRHIYGQRLGIVEPVFGNLRETLGLRRFSLRGRTKVDGQWKLMTMLHNIGKIHRYGWTL
ncbi:transposase of ISPca6, IS4 family [Syntrophotalea carbinolica DSM 2380]|uniref:Transposase of ISPca6, IS4 family n=1 Tax=Syntrophotalea carbinolica (strain DSM 2380 / NBRC 103641 / GraBd1) TaxID=338963 RepID=Q3A753_SYNC1|nr:IS1182 family transposase [Syntrophotalea carbinolica]ABA87794.1 transposase of ISPca6, IS4 family [Syntrophotalea carbinolica DSM 2380]